MCSLLASLAALPGADGGSEIQWWASMRLMLNKLPLKMHTAPVGFFQGADVCCRTVNQLGFILMTTEHTFNKDIHHLYLLISVNQGFQP